MSKATIIKPKEDIPFHNEAHRVLAIVMEYLLSAVKVKLSVTPLSTSNWNFFPVTSIWYMYVSYVSIGNGVVWYRIYILQYPISFYSVAFSHVRRHAGRRISTFLSMYLTNDLFSQESLFAVKCYWFCLCSKWICLHFTTKDNQIMEYLLICPRCWSTYNLLWRIFNSI